jgi:hypothetical protein
VLRIALTAAAAAASETTRATAENSGTALPPGQNADSHGHGAKYAAAHSKTTLRAATARRSIDRASPIGRPPAIS